MKIYLRALIPEDAFISYQWRNDPEVWKYTGRKPDVKVTPIIEKQWLEKVLSNNDEIRFAICINGTNDYIGNIQLLKISDIDAEFHIFIGDKRLWGKGIASAATHKLLKIGFSEYGLKRIYLTVNKNNIAAIKAYKKNGFKKDENFINRFQNSSKFKNQITMSVIREDFEKIAYDKGFQDV